MLKAILVDDEEMVRSGLRDHFPWSNHSISIVGDFPNGSLAFDFLKSNEVDLIITDIVMPIMDGMKLASKAREIYPEIKLIFVSGYTDAQYLLEALKLNASDFIFKSIDFKELDVAIERVCSSVYKAQEHKNRFEELKKQVDENKSLLIQQQYVSLLKKTEEPDEELEKSCAVLGIPLENHVQYILVVIRLANKWRILEDNHDLPDFLLDFEAQQLLQEVLKNYEPDIVFKSNSGEFVCLLNTKDKNYEDLIVNVSIASQAKLRNELGVELCLGISSVFSGLAKIPEAYANTCEAITNKYFIGDGLPSVSIARYNRAYIQQLEEKASTDILAGILDNDKTKIAESFRAVATEAQSILSNEENRNFLLFILMLPSQLLQNIPCLERGAYSLLEELFYRYLKCKDFVEKQDFILSVLYEAAGKIGKLNYNSGNAVVSKAFEYIEEHYMEQISVTSIADYVRLSPTYLCVMFKQATGQTINQSITKTRLTKAKALLEQGNLAVEEVCYKVGYLSTSYFSRLFRQNTGMTPSEYRNVVLSPPQ